VRECRVPFLDELRGPVDLRECLPQFPLHFIAELLRPESESGGRPG
jgi:hypothetical protein